MRPKGKSVVHTLSKKKTNNKHIERTQNESDHRHLLVFSSITYSPFPNLINKTLKPATTREEEKTRESIGVGDAIAERNLVSLLPNFLPVRRKIKLDRPRPRVLPGGILEIDEVGRKVRPQQKVQQ